MPLVSVITPAYNAAITVIETIESVLNQSFSDFEFIIIDDGSEDNTLSLVYCCQDPRLKVFSYPNVGVSASRNCGFYHSVGDYVSFLDADDLWTPDKLEMQVAALQGNSQAAVAYSWTDFIDESSRFLRPGAHTTVSGDVYAKLLVSNFLENGSNALIRRDAFTSVGKFDESLHGPEDWDLYLRLAARYDFVCVPRSQILYRVRTNSISANISELEHQSLRVIERAFNNSVPSLQHLKKASIASFYLYLTFRGIEGEVNPQKSFMVIRCLLLAVTKNPVIVRQRWRVLSIVLLKSIVGILLPPTLAQSLRHQIKGTAKS
ncbi:MAG TPA: glycosyl transferase family A [Cyanobacteria bacterium UBA8803]|nr:glycosyl transferase family A [Cyanobacteria bacterium UBA9273]HBL60235.1 glycosyl transferase family A [Cyanobacteria bacterium UBA8803]